MQRRASPWRREPREREAGQQGQSSPVGGSTFVLTGTLPSLSRSVAQALIEAAGGTVSGSVSKTTGYLVAGEVAGSKLAKAGALGVAVLDEAGLLALLQEDPAGSSVGDTTPLIQQAHQDP